MEMSEKIRFLRNKNGLTLEQVGDKVGVGKSTVRKWESGQIANMRRDKIAKLAEALDTTPAYLMGWEEEPAAPKPVEPELRPITDTELKFALFDGDQTITDAQFEEVKRFAQFIRERDRRDK